ncbi:MAG: primosomal protein N', partial [Proteobacteria bacterium]|nr:primosomal protein N' [Pseudomonadota bacterium]
MVAPHTSEAEAKFDAVAPPRRVHVLLPLPLGSAYDYSVPTHAGSEEIQVGDFVAVPLGRRAVVGVVWGEGSADPGQAVADGRLRPIAHRLPVPGMAAVTRLFVERLAGYTCASPGAVLRM